MKLTNLILLTEDDYNQLVETIANRVIQQLQGKHTMLNNPSLMTALSFRKKLQNYSR